MKTTRQREFLNRAARSFEASDGAEFKHTGTQGAMSAGIVYFSDGTQMAVQATIIKGPGAAVGDL